MAAAIQVRRAHVIQAFLLAPLAGPLTFWLMLASAPARAAEAAGIMLIYIPFAYAAALIPGTIAWVAFWKLGLTSGWAYGAGDGLIA